MFEAYLDHYAVGCANARREVLQNQCSTNKPIRSFGRIESIGYKVSEIGIINLFEGLPKFLRVFHEGLTDFGKEFLRVSREGLV